MADKLKIVVDEIRTSINQTSDDKKVSRAQVAFWVIAVGNNLLGKHISKRDSGAYLNVYTVPVKVSKETILPNIIKGRKYIELPFDIFDFDLDGGIDYMSFFDPDEGCEPEYKIKTIQRTTPKHFQWLMLREETRPSPSNSYFWRASNIIPIVGIESVPIDYVEIGIYQTISSLEDIDINQDFNFPGELLEQLKRQVTELARYSFLFPGPDNSNDGVDGGGNANVPKIVSVNQSKSQE